MLTRAQLNRKWPPARKWCLTFTLVISALWTASALSEDSSKQLDKPSAATLPPIVCLHTEYLHYRDKEALHFRLMRELARQALLIAARDELGLATRDETLGEVFPDSVTQAKQDVSISVRTQFDGSVRFHIWLAANPQKLEPTKKDHAHDAKVVLKLTEKLEPRTHGDLREMLQGLGFDGKAVGPNEKNLPSDSVEGQLLEMNFVSQFAVVRAGHEEIADKGPSRAWLATLARGYANLSLMTEHHWKSDTEAFAARALLYAERLVTAYPDDALAHASRAYVRAIVGLHGAALDEIRIVGDLRKKHPDQMELPAWFEVIEPYCSFEREPLRSIGERRPSMRQLAQRLSFEQLRAFGDDRWLFESAKQSMSICPEEYGIYAALARGSGSLLSVVRTGAYYAPAALAHFLPARIASLKDVPTDRKAEEEKPNPDEQNQPAPSDTLGNYAAATTPIIEALRTATKSGADKGEPTWSALGELIFEEEFVQAANYLNVAMNATESSHADEVKSILSAIKGHRFSRFIESYIDGASCGSVRLAEIIGDMRIVDPRGNMQPMLQRLWAVKTPGNRSGRGANARTWGYQDRSITFNGMLEAYNSSASAWDYTEADTRKEIADDFRKLSPHSPQALRLEMRVTEKPTYEQIAHWEAAAGEDPTAYTWVGGYFAQSEHFDDAIRAYERSISLSPTTDAYVQLAGTYRAAGQEDKWLPTLERFFEVESLGLEHASVHQIIANDLIDKGKWDEALPHATAAAETWSGWGLELASRVEEGLGHWEESEKWIREESTNYPTYSGDEWYFWCRRTGRGDLEESRKIIQAYLSADWIKTNLDGQLKVFAYHLAENDLKSAFDDAKKFVNLAEERHESNDMEYYQMHLALVGRESKDTAITDTAIKEIRELSEKSREKHPNLSAFNIAICDILDGKTIADDTRADMIAKMEKQPKETRCNCYYFLGKAYDLTGNKELADQYFKECVIRGPFGRYNATLAGTYLSDRNKTSRP